MKTQIGGKTCYLYDCGSSDVLLIQPVDDHDIEVLDSEVAEHRAGVLDEEDAAAGLADLRCGAALVIAGLLAEGVTEIHDVYHIDRGYDNIDGKLKASARDAAAAAGVTLASPKWQTTQYSVLLSRENNQWHIRNLTAVRVINEEEGDQHDRIEFSADGGDHGSGVPPPLF